MQHKDVLITYKVFFACLGLGAVLQEMLVLIDRGTFNFINFFSYFTNQSNLFAGIMLLVGAYALWKGSKSATIGLFRGAATLYMIITGVVFAVLLSDGDPNELTAVPIDNLILHYIMPVVLLLDWIIDQPKRKIAYRLALLWLAYPITYAVCSLIRGSNSGFYPYPFLNPDNSGYGTVFLYILGIAAFVAFAARLLTLLPLNKRKSKKA